MLSSAFLSSSMEYFDNCLYIIYAARTKKNSPSQETILFSADEAFTLLFSRNS